MDLTKSLDPEEFTWIIEDGVFVQGFAKYMAIFVDSRRLDGCEIYTDIYSGFCEVSELFVIGSGGSLVNSITIAGTVSNQHGRVLPAVFEMILCG